MKALIVNGNYKVGSTGKVMFSLYSELAKRGIDTKYYYGIDSGVVNDRNVYIRQSEFERVSHSFLGKLTGFQGCFSNHSTEKLISILKKNKPDIVFLGVLHGNYINIFKFLSYLKKERILCVQLMFDEYMMTGNCAYSYTCKKYESKCINCERIHDYPVSWFFDTSATLQKMKYKLYENFNSLKFAVIPYTAKKARNSYLLRDKEILELDEAIDTETLYFPRKTDALRKYLNIPVSHKVVLGVCLYSSKRKGGKYLLEIAKMLVGEEITFVHIGYDGKLGNLPDNFIPISFENNQEKMAEYYSLADVFVCTSIADTYPHTCLEALACGTPIIGFNVSAIPDCAEPPFGTYVDCPNLKDMADAIRTCKRKNNQIIENTSGYAKNRFSNKVYNAKLIDFALKNIKVGDENA